MSTETEVTMTVEELRALPHRLGKTKEIARLKDGRTFYWAHGRKVWVQGPALIRRVR